MAPQVLPMSDADFLTGFTIISSAFGQDQEFINIVYPAHETASGRAIGAKRLLATNNAQPHSTFIKAVDPDSAEIMGIAQWSIFQNHIPVEPESAFGTKEYWEDEKMADYAEAMLKEYFVDRREILRETGGNLVALDLLIVDPKHQRKGAGRALIRWGLQKADELGLDAIVESSDLGVPAYEAEGFMKLKRVVVDVPRAPEFADRPRQSYNWMYRAKKSGTT